MDKSYTSLIFHNKIANAWNYEMCIKAAYSYFCIILKTDKLDDNI